MGALSNLWAEMGALTFVGTLWAEMGALSNLWAEMGTLTFVGTLWAEMGALSNLWAEMGALSTLWSEMGALTFMGTLWAEMGALLKWEVPRSTWGQMGKKWGHNTCGKDLDLGPSGSKVGRNGCTQPLWVLYGQKWAH